MRAFSRVALPWILISMLMAAGWPARALAVADCVQALSCGEGEQVLLITTAGNVWAWGQNDEGEVGVETPKVVALARRVNLARPERTVASVTGIYVSAALLDDQHVVAWGGNFWGQLGSGDFLPSIVPREVVGLDGVAEISARGGFMLARRGDGSVWAWGENLCGQLGNGMVSSVAPFGVATPGQVLGLPRIVQVAAGGQFSFALAADGSLWGWGCNGRGQLATGIAVFGAKELRPVRSQLPVPAVIVSAGQYHALALDSTGTVWSWGANEYGQLGHGDTVDRSIPRAITLLPPIRSITAAGLHSMAIDHDGRLWAWGSNWTGELGQGTIGPTTSSAVPLLVPVPGPVELACGGSLFSLVKLGDGSVWAWGVNARGTLGNGSFGTGQVTGTPGLVTLPPPILAEALECPAAASVECGSSTDPAHLGFATAEGLCGALPVAYGDDIMKRCGGSEDRTRTWTASEGAASVSCTQEIHVRDTSPPTLSASGAIAGCLWPPNHRFVCLSKAAFPLLPEDACDPQPTWEIVGCRSSQPDDGAGDGSTAGDCVVSPGGDELCVRAERDGRVGAPREYSVLVVARDACGNASRQVVGARILVPHDEAQARQVCKAVLGPANR